MIFMQADQIATPCTVTMQVSDLLSHLTVTEPSISWSQKHKPAMSIPLLPAAKMMQFVMYLKWWLTEESFSMIYMRGGLLFRRWCWRLLGT